MSMIERAMEKYAEENCDFNDGRYLIDCLLRYTSTEDISHRECVMYAAAAKLQQLMRGESIDSATPQEWDAVTSVTMSENAQAKQAVESAERMADLMGKPVYIVELPDGLRVRTEERFRPDALEIVHPTESKNAKKST